TWATDRRRWRVMERKRLTESEREAINKRADRGAEEKAMLTEVMKQAGWIEKDGKVFMPSRNGGYVEVDLSAADRLAFELAGKGTSSEQMFPTPANVHFPTETLPMSGDGKSGNWPQRSTPYGRDEIVGTMTRLPG